MGLALIRRVSRSSSKRLRKAGYHAVSWDMPGYGRSAPLTPMTFPGLAGRLRQFLDELNVPAVHVVGHSIGGMIVQQLARTAQDKGC